MKKQCKYTNWKTLFLGPWKSVHIDDLRRSSEFVSDVHALKNLRISDLFEDPPEGKLYYYYLAKYYTVYFSLINTPLIFFHPAMKTEDQFGQPQNDNNAVSEILHSCTNLEEWSR